MNIKQRLSWAMKVLKGDNPFSNVSDFNIVDRALGKIQPGDYQAMVEAYRSWVYACITLISSSFAKAQLHLYSQKRDKRIEILDHPFLDTLAQVNPFMNYFELWELTLTYLETTGNAYWYLVNNRLGVPAELWVIPSQWMRIIPDKKNFIGGYLLTRGAQNIAFEPDEILHFKYPNPNDLYYGMSPLAAAAHAIDTDEYMDKYEMALFRNQARPDAVLETDKSLTDPEYKRLEIAWNKTHQGVGKAGKMAILEAGLKFKPMALSPRDLNFLAGRKFTRDQICNIFLVPSLKIGVTEQVNRANMDTADYGFEKDVILSKRIRIQEKINEKLMPRYDDNLFVEFEGTIPLDKEYALKERESNIKSGFASINEEREKVGLKPTGWGVVPLMPMSLMPVMGAPAKTVKAKKKSYDQKYRERKWRAFIAMTTPQENHFKDAMVDFYNAQEKVVLANLRRILKVKTYSKGLVDFIIYPRDEEAKKLEKVGRRFIGGALESGIFAGIADVGVDIDLDLTNPRVNDWLRKKTFKFSFVIDGTTERQLRVALEAGLQAGETITQLADRVSFVYENAKVNRSVLAARTETIDAANRGHLLAYGEAGVQWKEWLTALDEVTCEDCLVADGQQAHLNMPFPAGVDVPPLHPNCRCTVLPVGVGE